MHTLRSAPARVLNLVAVVTRLFRGSTAPTATSGVSITARIFGGRIKTDDFFRSFTLRLRFGTGRVPVLADRDTRPLWTPDPSDFRLDVNGELVD